MKLKLRRIFLGSYTIGHLYIDDKYFCDTLEDKNRDLNHNGKFDNDEKKVYGKTSIPFGTYSIELRRSPHFKRVLPRLLNVPNFEGVLIHRGNTAKDTSGCILLGENTVRGEVRNSTTYEKKIVKMMATATFNKQPISIEIIK